METDLWKWHNPPAVYATTQVPVVLPVLPARLHSSAASVEKQLHRRQHRDACAWRIPDIWISSHSSLASSPRCIRTVLDMFLFHRFHPLRQNLPKVVARKWLVPLVPAVDCSPRAASTPLGKCEMDSSRSWWENCGQRS